MKLPIRKPTPVSAPSLPPVRPTLKPESEIISPKAGPSILGKLLASSAANARPSDSSRQNDIAKDVVVTRSLQDERAYNPTKKDEYILVICDTPSHEVYAKNLGMGKKAKELFLHTANDKNLPTDIFVFMSPCAPMPDDVFQTSASRESKWLKDHRDEFLNDYYSIVEQNGGKPKAILTLGLHATQQAMGKAVKITRVRGQIRNLEEFGVPIVPMLSPGQVFRQPGMGEQFRVDFDMVCRLRDFDYALDAAELAIKDVKYSYISGQELLRLLERDKPSAIAWDTETYNHGKSNSWWAGSKPFIVQLCWKKGESYVVPIQSWRIFETRTKEYLAEHKPYDYWTISDAEAADNLRCIKTVLESGKYFFTGHNLAYDWHVMQNVGVTPQLHMWLHDSMQLMFVRDENTTSKDLATGTKLYVPDLSGYSDAFEDKADYSQMPKEHPEGMLFYSAADSDASLRMTRYLVCLTAQDSRNYNCYTRIQMPAIRMFYRSERMGMMVDKCKIREFTEITQQTADEQYEDLIGRVHPNVRQKWIDPRKPKNGLSFTRSKFLIDWFFEHPDGLRLTPVMFTKGTRKLEDPSLKVPMISAKEHLPYFEENDWIADYLAFNKFKTILQFAGVEGYDDEDDVEENTECWEKEKTEAKGIWKYIAPDGAIHPSFFLHRTRTGRVASANPNGQNMPKHGKLAKAYRAIFVARPGKSFISVDLSQAELRVAAWEAREKTMLRLYNEGADLHAATAARTMHLTMAEFFELDESIRDVKRQGAKAVNFGYLFGMWWKKFKAYAKQTYGVTFTDEESEESYNAYFDLYKGLVKWHKTKKAFVNETGYVRALHGRIRNLPSIRSYDKGVRQEAERQAINSTVQGFASDMCLIAAIRFTRDANPNEAVLLAPIHDALVIEVDSDKVDHYGSAMRWYMENLPFKEWFNIECPIPIVADIEAGPNLKDLVKMKHLPAIKPAWFTKD